MRNWPAAFAAKTNPAAAATREIARIRTGAKTAAALLKKNHEHCFDCDSLCQKGLLSKRKPYGFSLFAQRYGEAALLDCLERNEKAGVVYHREGIVGDYDGFDDVEKLIRFIQTGKK